jgi:hypothetical protein
MSLILPEHLRELHMRPMADAFKIYRDELRMHVYPCYGPKARVKDPGKHPQVSAWWDFDPRTCDLAKFFGAENGKCCNIGTCALSELKFLDLDSKADKGESVHTHVESHPILSKLPRHRTRGGEHLLFFCPDMPKWAKPNGRPHHDRLTAQVSDTSRAELFHCDRNNIILPPSIHEEDSYVYTWTVLGEVPTLYWKEIRSLYSWSEPGQTQRPSGRPRKEPPWYHAYRGQLSSLDLVRLMKELKIPVELVDEEDCKFKIQCPWEKEHSETQSGGSDTSVVIWQPGMPHWPSFKCLHTHGPILGLEQVLAWAAEQSPGIVDKHCAQQRVWSPGQKSAGGLPRILKPCNELDSVVYARIAEIVAPHHMWFIRGDTPTVITDVPSGYEYSEDQSRKYKISAYVTGFKALTGIEAKSDLEKVAEPGYLNQDGEFIKSSFNAGFMTCMLAASQFKERLPRIIRILTIPIPIRVGNKLEYPVEGYDPRFATYLMPSAPRLIHPFPELDQAIEILNRTMSGFCFTSEQSRVHAIARLITPFARGIFGWTTRVPLWLYCANRPRAGKDYLAGINTILYEGIAYEDSPIGTDSAETAKRIVAAVQAGRRFMHFSNCTGYLRDDNLYSAITNTCIRGRLLGSNSASADLTLPNELEFSISANLGLTARPDFEPRTRKIELAYYEEDPNSRVFPDKFLHEHVRRDRVLILSAIAAIFDNWANAGFPQCDTPFSSFPSWGGPIGGIMQAAGLGNPCLPFKGTFDIGHDPEHESMRALWEEAAAKFKNSLESERADIYALVDASETGALEYFGQMDDPNPPH